MDFPKGLDEAEALLVGSLVVGNVLGSLEEGGLVAPADLDGKARYARFG